MQSLWQTSSPQLSPLAHARVVPGVQPVAPEQLPKEPQLPHRQVLESQLRVRERVPLSQAPQASVSVCVSPGEHCALVVQLPQLPQAPQVQLDWQVRVRERVPSPHSPQLPSSVSVVPAVHSPSPLQV